VGNVSELDGNGQAEIAIQSKPSLSDKNYYKVGYRMTVALAMQVKSKSCRVSRKFGEVAPLLSFVFFLFTL